MNKLLTLGYQTTNITELAQLVKDHDALLADIRYRPYSAYPGWRQDSLKTLVGSENYEHVHTLGNVNYRGGPIQLLRPEAGFKIVQAMLRERNVILLCGCYELATCHRLVVASYIAERIAGLEVEHLAGFKLRAYQERQKVS
jgi:hypothetical protein